MRTNPALRAGAACLFVVVIAAPAAAAPAGRLVETGPGERLHVVEAGQGEAVLLVPGLFGSAYGYRRLTDQLARAGYRAVVVEPLGVGASDKPPRADYSLTAQADRLESALESLGMERVVVVAHAVGASMAFRLALRHPGRVKAIVSLDGGPTEVAATPGFRRAMRFSFLLRLAGVGRLRSIVRSTLEERSADPAWVTDEVVEGYLGEGRHDLRGTLAAFGQIAKAREPEALQPRLSELRCPVRLVVGTATRKGGVSEAEIRILMERVPSFAIDRVPQAGHFVFEEAPQAVLAAVAAVSPPTTPPYGAALGSR
jgi:pimeloyl-ACP methyl ester carboxylesterase